MPWLCHGQYIHSPYSHYSHYSHYKKTRGNTLDEHYLS